MGTCTCIIYHVVGKFHSVTILNSPSAHFSEVHVFIPCIFCPVKHVHTKYVIYCTGENFKNFCNARCLGFVKFNFYPCSEMFQLYILPLIKRLTVLMTTRDFHLYIGECGQHW